MREEYSQEDGGGYSLYEIPRSAIVGEKIRTTPKIDYDYLGKKCHRIMFLNRHKDSYSGYDNCTEVEGVLSPSTPGNFHFRGVSTSSSSNGLRINRTFPIKAIAYLNHYDWLNAPDEDRDKARAYLKTIKQEELDARASRQKKDKLFGIF